LQSTIKKQLEIANSMMNELFL